MILQGLFFQGNFAWYDFYQKLVFPLWGTQDIYSINIV